MTNTNGWDEYKLLILHHMEENEKRHTQILERLDRIDETNVESKGQRKADSVRWGMVGAIVIFVANALIMIGIGGCNG